MMRAQENDMARSPAHNKKYMIFGRPGSGKTTLALKLHKSTNIPLYHLDKYFFLANWVERPTEEFLALQRELVNQDAWIIDGNCISSLEMRYAKADVCLYMNLPRLLCLGRIIKRLFQKRTHIDDRADNCPETINYKLIKYLWTFNERVANKIEYLRKQYPQVRFVEINSTKQINNELLNVQIP